jgi:hypothetical protein
MLYLSKITSLVCLFVVHLAQSWTNSALFSPLHRIFPACRTTTRGNTGLYYNPQDVEETEDWRDMRAKLIMQFRGDSSSSSIKKWVYDSGDVIETGSLLVSHPIQDFVCGGLRQQYFHKCVVLVIHHEPGVFTKGIILNRPTKETMKDDKNVEWNVWFGGGVQGLDSEVRDFTCLHRLESPLAQNLSMSVVKDLQVSRLCRVR